MEALKAFLKNTLVGGLVFLIPLGLILVVFKQVMGLATGLVAPIAAHLPVKHFAGVAIVTLLAALVLLLIAFLAGLLARTGTGRRMSSKFEESILGGLPQYRMVKSMAEGLTHIESGAGMHPALLRTDEGWQLAYRLEDLPDGWTAVFVPQAPTPMSGDVLYVPTQRLRPLPFGMPVAINLVKSIGVGSAQALHAVSLGSAQDPQPGDRP